MGERGGRDEGEKVGDKREMRGEGERQRETETYRQRD